MAAVALLSALGTFSGLVAKEALGASAQRGDPAVHLQAAEDWLKRAHDQNDDDGVSYGYSVRGGWRPSYRETSGYIATTFFELARQRDDADYRERALRICRWLLSVQNSDGSFSNPRYGNDGIVFDTGQVLFGLVRAAEETGEADFLQGAQRAAQWLVTIADQNGCWTRNEHLGVPHVYNTRTAWALLRLNQIDPSDDWVRVARANLDWALSEQHASGFFRECSFERGVDPSPTPLHMPPGGCWNPAYCWTTCATWMQQNAAPMRPWNNCAPTVFLPVKSASMARRQRGTAV